MRLYRALRSYSYGSRGFQTTDDGHDHRQGAPSTLSRGIALQGQARARTAWAITGMRTV